MPSLLYWLFQRVNDFLAGEVQLAVFVCPPIEVFAECPASHGQCIAVDHLVLQQIRKNLCGKDVLHAG